jgi:hypothetical protein
MPELPEAVGRVCGAVLTVGWCVDPPFHVVIVASKRTRRASTDRSTAQRSVLRMVIDFNR